jgi:hypothetical protein
MSAASLVLLALFAQEGATTASPESKARAQELLSEGAIHYERAEFADALENFQKAYAVFPSPKLLFNIGQASRELGRPVEAVEAFEKFLAQAGDAGEAMTAEAKRSLAELTSKIGKLLIECPIAGAEISVDGRKLGLAPIQDLVRVAPGTHQLTATHPSATPAIETVNVMAGTIETVVMRPRTLAEVAAALPPPPPPTPSPGLAVEEPNLAAPVERAGWLLGRRWTWVAAGSAVVLAGGAAFAGWQMQKKFDELDHQCGSASLAKQGCTDLSAVDLRKNVANVLWGLTAAAAVTTGILYFVEGHAVTVTPVAGHLTGLVATANY